MRQSQHHIENFLLIITLRKYRTLPLPKTILRCATSEALRNYSGNRTFCCGQCMQNERQQLLLITSYNGVYQEYKISIHSLWHAVEVLPQPSYETSLCKLAIAYMHIVGYEFESSDCVPSRDTYRMTSLVETRIEFESQIVVCCLLPYNF